MGVRTRVGGWRGRSRIAQVDSYMRWTLYLLPCLFPLSSTLSLVSSASDGSGAAALVLLATGWAQCGVGVVLFRRALEHYRLRHPAPWRWAALSGVLLAVSVVQLVAMVRANGPSDVMAPSMVIMCGTLTFFGALSLLAPRVRTYLWWCLLGGIGTGVAILPFGGRPAGAVVTVLMVWAGALWALATVRSTGWMLAVMWEADHARTVQARLAVAEERLRFGRDMHDVLGRNLTVIALKSELAAQLAHRGSPAALEQMTEVQRIARDAQRDMRELVRGYRRADLHTELVGARGVLGAAGIACRIDDTSRDALPDPVQSALAWVVREGTTNVLRHADARRCAIRLRIVGPSAVLIMENDGAGVAPDAGSDSGSDSGPGGSRDAGRRGSGLAGLRERMAALGGTLEAGHRAKRTFRLTAEVPLAAVEVPPVVDVPAVADVPAEGDGPAGSQVSAGVEVPSVETDVPGVAGVPTVAVDGGRSAPAAGRPGAGDTKDAQGAGGAGAAGESGESGEGVGRPAVGAAQAGPREARKPEARTPEARTPEARTPEAVALAEDRGGNP
ncbi:sensor histidine kinase [Streptomyces sp. URMC 126]|uniref:sensor histidine kinase n=1 Tax=Streptomyces sp. URMC 126 TaxID=3423401 RepID=UPI003F1CC34B